MFQEAAADWPTRNKTLQKNIRVTTRIGEGDKRPTCTRRDGAKKNVGLGKDPCTPVDTYDHPNLIFRSAWLASVASVALGSSWFWLLGGKAWHGEAPPSEESRWGDAGGARGTVPLNLPLPMFPWCALVWLCVCVCGVLV